MAPVPWIRRHLTVAGDTAAVALLVLALVHLAGHDGGRPLRPTATAVTVGLLALPALLPELARRTVRLRVLVGLLALGPLVSAVVAPFRAGMARPLLVAALAPLVFLAVRRVWHRSWGPPAVGGLVALAVGRAWYQALLAWWGSADLGGSPQWLALSWHNQSGALMGAAAVALLALGALLRGRAGALAALAAGPLLAAAWLSGSRGAVVATVLGVVLVGAAALRRVGARQVVLVGLVAAVVAGGAVAGLTAMTETGGQPVAQREQTVGRNLTARLGHAEAALRMAGARPLAGYGPGSYRWASRAHYPQDTNLTSSAHTEYLEAFGEGGLLWGGPVLVAALGIAWLGLLALRPPPGDAGRASGRDGQTPAPGDGAARRRDAGRVAALGLAAVLGLHAGVDFDWDYALLAALLALAAAVLHAEAGPAGDAADPPGAIPDHRWASWISGLALGLLGVGALAAAGPSLAGVSAPWDLEARLVAGVDALQQGEPARAREELRVAGRWNPGSRAVPLLGALVEHVQGRASADYVVAAIDPREHAVRDQLLAVGRLVAVGETEAAERILSELRPVIDERRAWGSREPAMGLARWSIEAAAEAGGCGAARARLGELASWLRDHGAEPAEVAAQVERCSLREMGEPATAAGRA